MNMWVNSTVALIPDAVLMKGAEEVDVDAIAGRNCYAVLDLSSTEDITALVLIFPPRDEMEKYILLPFFWVPEDTISRRVKHNSVPYDVWEKQGYILSMEGNSIHGGNPVLRWKVGNVVVDTELAGNIKMTKARAKEKSEGIVAAIMELDWAQRNGGQSTGSIYDERGLLL